MESGPGSTPASSQSPRSFRGRGSMQCTQPPRFVQTVLRSQGDDHAAPSIDSSELIVPSKGYSFSSSQFSGRIPGPAGRISGHPTPPSPHDSPLGRLFSLFVVMALCRQGSFARATPFADFYSNRRQFTSRLCTSVSSKNATTREVRPCPPSFDRALGLRCSVAIKFH